MKYSIAIFLSVFFSCSNNKNNNKEIMPRTVLDARLFDSIQVFVKHNLDNNLRSEFHLLSLENYKNDTFTFILTSVLKDMAFHKYRNCIYLNNRIDHSLLIIDDKLNYVYSSSNYPVVTDLIASRSDTNKYSMTFNPLVWKIYVTKNQIVMDKLYGQRVNENQILIPSKKFTIPKR